MASVKNSKNTSVKGSTSVKSTSVKASKPAAKAAVAKPAKAKASAFNHIGTSEYNGHDLITFAKDAKDTRPFQFGKSKAAQLLAALENNGADAVIKALRDLIDGE